MRKLLLQSAIATLVSTGVASNVMAGAPATATANVTLQGTGTQLPTVPTVTANISLNLILPVKANATFTGTSKTLNALYDTATASTNSGCVEINNIATAAGNGGISKINIGENLTLTSATKSALLANTALLKTDSIIKNVTFAEGASCLAAKPAIGTVSITVAAKGDLTLTNAEIGKAGANKDKIAVYYQLDATALGSLELNPSLLSKTKNEKLSGNLTFTLTL